MAFRRRYRSSAYVGDYKRFTASYLLDTDAYKFKFSISDSDKFKNLVEVIKATIPDSERSFDYEFKEWTISNKYFGPLLELIKILYPEAEYKIADKAKVEEFNQGSTNTAVVVAPEKLAEQFFVMLEMAGLKPQREALTVSAIRKDYLRASLFYHPDRNNGDGKNMSELNYLWQSLKGTYFKIES